MNVSATAAEWAADQAKTEAEAFENALNRIKTYTPADEVEQAFRQGMTQGKSTEWELFRRQMV